MPEEVASPSGIFKMNKNTIGIAGEFYVLAQLAQRELVAALTLSNTKGIDILVSNASLNRLYRVEVKTTEGAPTRESLFSEEPVFSWAMSEKHEAIDDPALFFCFVVLHDTETLPRFFIVPSSYVAQYVREQHQYWLRTRLTAVADTTMRRFRIRTSDPLGFENNWGVFVGESIRSEHLRVTEPWFPGGDNDSRVDGGAATPEK
jgi:hypothetical protein